MNTSSAEAYLKDGCGRCAHYRTPACKVNTWRSVLVRLRKHLVATDLKEEMKWGSPCYTWNGKNVVMLAAFRDSCALSFFKGASLADEAFVLEKAGPNSHIARLLRFRSMEEFLEKEKHVPRLLALAIALEKEGKVTKASKPALRLPAELAARLAREQKLRQAFDALTPGRQRSHVLYISSAKQTETRHRRVEKCLPLILGGRGFNER